VRTTIDLPADLHRLAITLARSNDQTLSQFVTGVLRRALLSGDAPGVSMNERNGLPVVRLGRPITDQDVVAADDDA
jgi:hypothetical protein